MTVMPIEFLQAMYPQQPPMGRWVLGFRSTRGGIWRFKWVHTLETMARLGYRHRRTNNIFFAPAIQEPKDALALARSRRSRVKLDTVPGATAAALALPALWLELEVAQAGQDNLPPNPAAALGLLAAIPLAPSIVISHRGGFDVYWLLRQFWNLETADDRTAAIRTLSRLRWAAVSAAADHGWQLDPEVRLTGHLRLPGSLDHGVVRPGVVSRGQRSAGKRRPKPVLVAIDRFPLPGEDRRYEPAQFEGLPAPPNSPVRLPIRAIVAQAKVAPPAELEPVFDGCGWLRQCYVTRHKLPANAWHAALGVVGRSQTSEADGRSLAHWISEGHPGTTRAVTDDALDRALASPSPSCDTIANKLQGKACLDCPHRNKITGPLDLGRGTNRGRLDAEPQPTTQAVGQDPSQRQTPLPSSAEAEVNLVTTFLSAAEIRVYGADGALVRAWGPLANKTSDRQTRQQPSRLDTTGPDAPSQHDAIGEFILGLEQLLADLGGSATARQMVTRLAATVSTHRHRRLWAALAVLDPRCRDFHPPSARSLGMLIGRHAGEMVNGAKIEHHRRTRQGIAWRAQRQPTAVVSSQQSA